MPNPFFSGRIPKELLEKAEQYARNNGKTKTEILMEALSQYLDFPLKVEVEARLLEQLEGRIKALEDTILSNKKSSRKPRQNSVDEFLVTHSELLKRTDITKKEWSNLKKVIHESAENEGYEVIADIKFKPAIKVDIKKGLRVDGQEYLLFCDGVDGNNDPEWKLTKSDNIYYQTDIIDYLDKLKNGSV